MTDLGWLHKSTQDDAYTISVITVTRRDFPALESTLSSLGSRDSRVEVIVVEGDDSSWPDSERIRSNFSNRWPSLRWLREPDDGIYAGMNKGIMAARGRWIWFLNSGDRLATGSTITDVLGIVDGVSNDTDWVIGSAVVRDRNGRAVRVKKAEDYSREGLASGDYTPCHQAVLTKREALARHGGFDGTLRIAADYLLFLRLAMSSTQPAIRPRFLVDYLEGGQSERARSRRIKEYAYARRAVLSRGRRECYRDFIRAFMRAHLPNHAIRLAGTVRRGLSGDRFGDSNVNG